MEKEIREATVTIKRGQHTILDGVCMLEDVLEGYITYAIENMGDGASRSTSDPLSP